VLLSSRRPHPHLSRDWTSDVCSSDLSLGRFREIFPTPLPTTMHPVVAGAAQADKVFQFQPLVPIFPNWFDVVHHVSPCQALLLRSEERRECVELCMRETCELAPL